MLNLFQHPTGQYTALHYRGFTFELVSADGVLKQVQHDKEVVIQAKVNTVLCCVFVSYISTIISSCQCFSANACASCQGINGDSTFPVISFAIFVLLKGRLSRYVIRLYIYLNCVSENEKARLLFKKESIWLSKQLRSFCWLDNGYGIYWW